MVVKKFEESPSMPYEACHDGEGILMCRSLLDDMGSLKFRYMHWDDMKAGVSIGDHLHSLGNEEIYFLLSGKAILTFDGEKYEMNAGDIHLCPNGHSHALEAVEDCVLIVVANQIEK